MALEPSLTNYDFLGVLAYGILQMRGVGGLAGWQVSDSSKWYQRMRNNFNNDCPLIL